MPETVSVRKVNGLPRASFSRNLAVQALPLAMCLAPPPALRDFHPVEFAHAERTRKKSRRIELRLFIVEGVQEGDLRSGFNLCLGSNRDIVFDFADNIRHRNNAQITLLERNVDLAFIEFTEHGAADI